MDRKHSIVYRELQDAFVEQSGALVARRLVDNFHSSQDERGYARAAVEIRNQVSKEGVFVTLWDSCVFQKTVSLTSDFDVQKIYSIAALSVIELEREKHIKTCTVSSDWMNNRISEGLSLNDFDISSDLTYAREMAIALTGVRDRLFSFVEELYPDLGETIKLSTTQELQAGERLSFVDNLGRKVVLVTGQKGAVVAKMGGLPLVLFQDVDAYRQNLQAMGSTDDYQRHMVFNLSVQSPQLSRYLSSYKLGSGLYVDGWGMLGGEESITCMQEIVLRNFCVNVSIEGHSTFVDQVKITEVSGDEVLALMVSTNSDIAGEIASVSQIQIDGGDYSLDTFRRATFQVNIRADSLDMALHLVKSVVDDFSECLSIRPLRWQCTEEKTVNDEPSNPVRERQSA